MANTTSLLSGTGKKAELPSGVKVTGVNYEHSSSLAAALKGHDALVIYLSVAASTDIETRLIDAAAKAGVLWVVPNEWGPDYTSNPEVAKVM